VKPSRTAVRLRELLQGIALTPPPPPAKEPEPLSQDQMEEMLKATLKRLMGGGT
jgi:hypothetical protein